MGARGHEWHLIHHESALQAVQAVQAVQAMRAIFNSYVNEECVLNLLSTKGLPWFWNLETRVHGIC